MNSAAGSFHGSHSANGRTWHTVNCENSARRSPSQHLFHLIFAYSHLARVLFSQFQEPVTVCQRVGWRAGPDHFGEKDVPVQVAM
jgi:hypothetical protein